jgi:hypothetical protein
MKTFTAFIVCQSLDIQAETIEEAEERYSEFFDSGESCAKHEEDCDCFSFDDSNVFHYFDEENEEANLHRFARVMAKAMGKFSGLSLSATAVIDYIMNEFTNEDDSEWEKLWKAVKEQQERLEREEDPEN